MKKGILFDLDGTLWDSSAEVVEAWNIYMSEHTDRPERFTVDDAHRFMGRTLDDIAAIAFPDLPKADALGICKGCIDAEQGYLKDHKPRIFPNEREIMAELAKSYTLGIVSNCQDGYIQLYLEQCGFAELFSDFECVGRTGKSKGENIRLVIERQGIDINGCIYIGDTQGDCKAAKSAGVPFVHAAYGFGSVDDCVAVLNSLNELPEAALRLLEASESNFVRPY